MIRGSLSQPESASPTARRERERLKKARWRARVASDATRATIARRADTRWFWEALASGLPVVFTGPTSRARYRAHQGAARRGFSVRTVVGPIGLVVIRCGREQARSRVGCGAICHR